MAAGHNLWCEVWGRIDGEYYFLIFIAAAATKKSPDRLVGALFGGSGYGARSPACYSFTKRWWVVPAASVTLSR